LNYHMKLYLLQSRCSSQTWCLFLEEFIDWEAALSWVARPCIDHFMWKVSIREQSQLHLNSVVSSYYYLKSAFEAEKKENYHGNSSTKELKQVYNKKLHSQSGVFLMEPGL
jgi:hypothetical protein